MQHISDLKLYCKNSRGLTIIFVSPQKLHRSKQRKGSEKRFSEPKWYRHCRYSLLIGSGEIIDYLASVDAEANEMYESLIADFAKAEDVDENLKATDQMRWIQRMQSIANRVREIVEKEVIFR